jgi:hypothetical protein
MQSSHKLYYINGTYSFNPTVEVNAEQVVNISENDSVVNYGMATMIYDKFCQEQTKKGQARKNERQRARKRIFKGFSEETVKEFYKLISFLKENAINELPSKQVIVDIDGRKKKNLRLILSGIELAVNVGGMSPQYYSLGLKDYHIRN